MKEKLYEILTELTVVEEQLEAITHILGLLEEHYETKNQMEAYYNVLVFENYSKIIGAEVAKIINRIDETILKI